MTVTATYLGDLSRVRVSFTGAPASADYAIVEKSFDGTRWELVRGGLTVPISGGAGKLDDYEFRSGVLATYRCKYVDTAQITYINQGTHATGNWTNVVPGLPAGLTAGATMLLFAAVRTGTPSTPAGWTLELDYGVLKVFSRRWVTGDTAPTVTFTGGAVGDSTSAVIQAWNNLGQGWTTANGSINATSQNISTATIGSLGAFREIVHVAWKQNGAATAGSTLTPFGATTTLANALGNGQSLFLSRVSASTNTQSVLAQTMTITGGVTAISRSLFLVFAPAPFVSSETATITPSISAIWLKSPTRPSLNSVVTVTSWGDEIARNVRSGLFDVVGRTMPVAVTELQGSRRMPLTLRTTDAGQADAMDNRLATGEALFLHTPFGCALESMYILPIEVSQTRPTYRSLSRNFNLSVVEVAAPESTIAGSTILYIDVTAMWATYAEVLVAKATYSDLVDTISVAEVIVP